MIKAQVSYKTKQGDLYERDFKTGAYPEILW